MCRHFLYGVNGGSQQRGRASTGSDEDCLDGGCLGQLPDECMLASTVAYQQNAQRLLATFHRSHVGWNTCLDQTIAFLRRQARGED